MLYVLPHAPPPFSLTLKSLVLPTQHASRKQVYPLTLQQLASLQPYEPPFQQLLISLPLRSWHVLVPPTPFILQLTTFATPFTL